MLKRAKELLYSKERCFNQHAKQLLNLHKELSYAIIGKTLLGKDPIEEFYALLFSMKHPFQYLANTSQMIREYFTAEPHQILVDAIIKGKSTDFGSASPPVRYTAAKIILDQAFEAAKDKVRNKKKEASSEENIRLNYISCMGEILGSAAKQIILQYMSEDLVFPPPILTPFEQKVQAAAYQHLEDFLSELTLPSGSPHTCSHTEIYEQIGLQIKTDIDFFRGEKKIGIPQELAEYFLERYQSLTNLPS